MDETIRRTLGDPAGLLFDLRLSPVADERRSLAWGGLRVDVAGEPVWYVESDEGTVEPVLWTWADLLEFLGKKWLWLNLEETYPFPVFPLHPGHLRQEMERRWESASEEMEDVEGEALFAFENRHDLARGVKGLFLPSIFLLRQGRAVWVCTAERQILLPFEPVRRALGELGAFLAEFLAAQHHSRAAYAVQCWRNRKSGVDALFWDLRTGLKEESRRKLESSESPDSYWELTSEEDIPDNEILAAARLSAGVASLEDQKEILARIKGAERGDFGRLDGISRRLGGEGRLGNLKPYAQGYALAGDLTREMDLAGQRPVDMDGLLWSWGVEILEIPLDDCPVDAVAVWGRRHGPLILLNIGRGARPGHLHGRRTTLAHELCHLLVDREGFLPFSEVLGGRTPVYVERRARAFAAEFLLPRAIASEYVRRLDSVASALDRLSEDFQVSREVAALQVRNSHAYMGLGDEERNLISRISGASELGG